jgi:4'-phosphopantetheinyl transferase EntD
VGVEWVTVNAAEVPEDDGWLGPRERALLAALAGERRAEWRLGRWAAKRLLGDGVEVLPAADGAPEAWRGDERLALSISIGHRKGRALAAAGEGAVGCDLEPLRDDRDVVPFVAWEAAAKALRRGLLGGERPHVDVGDAEFVVEWRAATVRGTWWIDDGYALATASA